MTTSIARLSDRGLIAVEGSDAEHFLQNLLTCDVERLEDGAVTFGALLTPQGKILFDFFVHRRGHTFIVETQADVRDDLLKRLMFYRLRAAVDLSTLEGGVFVSWPDVAAGMNADPRLAALGGRGLVDMETNSDEAAWHAHRIAYGVPASGADFALGDLFPHEAGMDQFADAGVDFTKGCYVGQEVVSRMQHRGTARNRFVHVTAAEGSPLPESGTDITAGDRNIGTMGSHHEKTGLAMVRLDRVANALAESATIYAGDTAVSVSVPDYATYALSA